MKSLWSWFLRFLIAVAAVDVSQSVVLVVAGGGHVHGKKREGEREREREWMREWVRVWVQERERKRAWVQARERESESTRAIENETRGHRDTEKQKPRDSERARECVWERAREKERERERAREWAKESEREREKERARASEGERERERTSEREREREREREKKVSSTSHWKKSQVHIYSATTNKSTLPKSQVSIDKNVTSTNTPAPHRNTSTLHRKHMISSRVQTSAPYSIDYGVATLSRLLNIVCLICKRAI